MLRKIKNQRIKCGGGALNLFEMRPLEDTLADIAVGWNDTQRCIGRVRADIATEVSYILYDNNVPGRTAFETR